MTDYKVLSNGRSCHGGRGKWTPNRRRSVRGSLVPCRRGIHYCRDEQVLAWLDDELWEFVDLTPGEAIDAGDKMVTRAGKVTKKYEAWNERTARLFAVDCSRIAVNRYARHDQRELLHACLDVLIGCARAAESAALSAEWSAAESAALSAARSAAASAAESAARSAARSEQYALLCRYLGGEEGPFVEARP